MIHKEGWAFSAGGLLDGDAQLIFLDKKLMNSILDMRRFLGEDGTIPETKPAEEGTFVHTAAMLLPALIKTLELKGDVTAYKFEG